MDSESSSEPGPSKTQLRKIRINYGDGEDDFVNILVKDNVVTRKTLEDNFEEGSLLTFKQDGEPFLLESDEHFVYISKDIDTYDLKRGPGKSTTKLGPKRRKRFHECMDVIYTGKSELNEPSSIKKKLTGNKIGNKKQAVSKEDEALKAPLPFEKRVIYIGWKHKVKVEDPYVHMGTTLAPVIKVVVNKNEEYSIEKLRNLIVENYVNEENKSFFDNCTVIIGTADGRIINNFVHEGKDSFWEYTKILRKSNHKLRINIYTTKKVDSSTINTNSKTVSAYKQVNNKEQLPSCSSAKSNEQQKNLHERYQPGKHLQDLSNLSNLATDVSNNLCGNHSTKDSFLDKFPSCSWIKNMKCDIESSVVKDETSYSLKSLDCTSKNKRPELHQQSTLCIEASNSINNFEKSIDSPLYSAITIKNDQENAERSGTNFDKMCTQPDSGTDKKSYSVSSDSSGESFTFLQPNDRVHNKIQSSNLSIAMIKPKELQFSNKILGKGGQGTVFKGKYLGSHVAIKYIQKGAADKSTLKEIMLLNKIHHPNIILIMAVCSTYSQTQIVMEYFKSDSLYTIIFDPKIRKNYDLNDKTKGKIAYQIACALSYLHLQSVPIVHRDIKPNNVLVNDNLLVKVCDLGLADSQSLDQSLQSTRNSMQGTYLFMAPEILMHNQKATTKSDVWSFACTVTSMYNESPVWDVGSSPSGFHCAYQNFDAKNVPKLDKVPMCLKEQLKRCFNYDPQCRPSMIELLHFFENLLK